MIAIESDSDSDDDASDEEDEEVADSTSQKVSSLILLRFHNPIYFLLLSLSLSGIGPASFAVYPRHTVRPTS